MELKLGSVLRTHTALWAGHNHNTEHPIRIQNTQPEYRTHNQNTEHTTRIQNTQPEYKTHNQNTQHTTKIRNTQPEYRTHCVVESPTQLLHHTACVSFDWDERAASEKWRCPWYWRCLVSYKRLCVGVCSCIPVYVCVWICVCGWVVVCVCAFVGVCPSAVDLDNCSGLHPKQLLSVYSLFRKLLSTDGRIFTYTG